MEEKVKIIDEICKLHPSYGVDLGWSKYVGGMTDAGEWFFRKMLDVPLNELEHFLNKVKEEIANHKPEVLSKEDKKLQDTRTFYESGHFSNALEDKRWKELCDERDRLMFFNY